MITCPKLDLPIYTGMNFDWEDFDATPIGEKSLRCPRCGETHRWARVDAFLEEDGGES